MNAPLRRLSVVVAAMFVVLMGAGTWVQFLDAGSLRADPRDSRALYAELGRQRGPITAGDTTIAESEPVDDAYRYRRTYPDGELYSAVTGSYAVTGQRSGLEDAEDGLLSGSADQLFYRRVSDLLTGRQPAGAVVETTLVPQVQEAARTALRGQAGAVVALDPRTGDVLAMYSSPGYDPNALASHDTAAAAAARASLEAADGDPLVSKATAQRYPPGSTFKLVDVAAALQSGRYTADSVLDGPASITVPGTSTPLANDDDRACGDAGRVSLADALTVSCNTAFANLGLELGQDALAAQARAFGFGTPLQVPLDVAQSTFATGTLTQPQLAQSSIGQYEVAATPLQVAMVASAVADRGVLMKPNLVRTVRGSDLEVLQAPEPEELGRPVSEATAATMTTMMEAVVDRGTGTAAQIPGVGVAGKTGTAQHDGGAPHAWFTAFAPADDPTIALAVFVEDGGSAGDEASGGRVAAPVAKAVIQARLAQLASTASSASATAGRG